MTNIIFEKSRKLDEQYQEYWTARQLAKDLDYAEYRNFLPVIEKAKMACVNSGHEVDDHFVHINEMVKLGSTATRQIDNIRLTRYACYLVVQNADPSKQIVALGQSYFASQTRKQELTEQHHEDTKRIHLRDEMKTHNKNLASAASRAGVTDYRQFTEAGYAGLYGGMKSADIHTHKWLKENEKILDHMNSEELAANLFRATQTESKIKREQIKWQRNATLTHYEVGKKVRQTIQDFWGTMPEDLPVVENIKVAKNKLKGATSKKSITQNF